MILTLHAPLAGLVRSLDQVPDPVFAERMLGDGIAIDPTGDTLHAPCAGTVATLQPTGHAVTIRTEAEVDVLIHLGIDTVALEGRGFEPLVAVGDRVVAGDRLIRFDLDLLVREAPAVVTPILVIGERTTTIASPASGAVAVGDPLMTVTFAEGAAAPSAAPVDGEIRCEVVVTLAHGVHARPAARIAAFAREADAVVTLRKADREASARSPTALLALGIVAGDRVSLVAAGEGGDRIVAAIATVLTGDDDPPAAPPLRALPPATEAVLPPGALRGVTAAPGFAIGVTYRAAAATIEPAQESRGHAEEAAALASTLAGLREALDATAHERTEPARTIAEAHRALLDDPELVETAEAAIARGDSAGIAWRDAIRVQVDALRATRDARLSERADDLLDIERRVLAGLAGAEARPFAPPAGSVVIADDLLPSDMMAIRPGSVAALCVARGGPTSHVAILAAAAGIPMLVALGPRLAEVTDGATVIVDATGGVLDAAPDADRLAAAEASIAETARRRAAMTARGHEACRTADGTRIELFANLGSRADAEAAVAAGAEGCGLLRTEFLFLDRDTMPDVAEQAESYQAIADALSGRPLIVRLLDIGGDKPAPYLPIAAEENPALGVRGIRVGLARPEVLDAQLRAILGVRPTGQCRIMLPMVASLDEIRAVRRRLDALREEMGIADAVELGAMVETPAAAVTADLLAAEADFVSIGTNDLTQYVLAMDRGNPAVAAGIDGLHPAVLRLIGETVRGAGTRGRWTGVCGGLASDPLAVPILIGLGVTELSAVPAILPDIRMLVTRIDIASARDHASAAIACDSAAAVRMLARAYAEGLR